MKNAGETGTIRTRVPIRSLLALGILLAGFCASLYVLVGSPLGVRAAGQAAATAPASQSEAPPSQPSATSPSANVPSANYTPRIRRPLAVQAPSTPVATPAPASESEATASAKLDQAQVELDAALDEVRQTRENIQQASEVQRRTLLACALFLAVFAVIAIAVVVQVSLQLRAWRQRSLESLQQVEAVAANLKPLQDSQDEIRRTLPKLLQQVGEQPLNFQEQGARFPWQSLTVLDDIDHLAYVGDSRLAFSSFSQPQDATVYLNGLLLSAVAHLARNQPWTAHARLDQFFALLTSHPDAVDPSRIAQAYSYRAQAAYQLLETQDAEPSWLRRSERSQVESLARQGFEDVARSARLDPEWKHATFVEAQLCSRFYLPDDPSENTPRSELFVRGLRRAVTLYKQLIEERAYRGPARHNLARCLKRVAEHTGDKSDFSDFGYALSSFPTDEELSDEALAARQPTSQDRFLWQWMLSDPELFRALESLNLAEYRSFWVKLLDTKVHLRNWRADLTELQQKDPAMRNWAVQLQHAEPAISLANPSARRPERFDTTSSGS
jgi:hypothetical protein